VPTVSIPLNKIETYSANKRSIMDVYEAQPVFKITIPSNDMDLIWKHPPVGNLWMRQSAVRK
jgi:hypothetical protein